MRKKRTMHGDLIRNCLAGGFWSPYLTYVFISLAYASVAGSLVSFIEPLAAGSGIAEVKTYLNGIHIKGLLTVRSFKKATLFPVLGPCLGTTKEIQ